MTRERLRAVALIVANPAGEILTLEEFDAKPELGKLKGMRSIPMETCEPGESYEDTVRRLHYEELAGLPSVLLPGRRIGVYRVVPGAWAQLYATVSATYQLPVMARGRGVGNHLWESLQKATEHWLRQGALEMIRDYAGGLENVLCRECSQPRLPAWV